MNNNAEEVENRFYLRTKENLFRLQEFIVDEKKYYLKREKKSSTQRRSTACVGTRERDCNRCSHYNNEGIHRGFRAEAEDL